MKIALIGYGKMGKTIDETLKSSDKHEVVARFDSKNPVRTEELSKADVAIEFSRPETARENVFQCFELNIPVVSGTTAWESGLHEAQQFADENGKALFHATNFSLGVNIFWQLNKKMASIMGSQKQYDVDLHEIHHTEKLDAPSGTAITTAEIILENHPTKTSWTHIEDETGQPVSSEQMVITSERTPKVPGTHIVRYKSSVDCLELKHEAFSRKGFAEGAILAAEWLVGKQGSYGMADLLNWEE